MKQRWGSLLGLVTTLAIVGVAVAFWIVQATTARSEEAPKPVAPASQTKAVKEAELNVLTLTAEAEARLDLKIDKVVRRKVEGVRLLAGDVVLPTGRAVTVSAPFAGQVRAAPDVTVAPGRTLKKGQRVFTLMPLLTSEARTSMATALVDAEGQVKNAEVQFKAAEVALARARQLLSEEAGTRRGVDEAQAAFDLAQKTQEAAVARREQIARALKGAETDEATAINIDSPEDGMVRGAFVAPGQVVASGTMLFEVVNQSSLWVRVPVYVGDLSELATEKPANVGTLGGGRKIEGVSVKPIVVPPSASAAGATVDLFYELDNSTGSWVPGQRVAVTVPLRSEQEELVIPWSAVVHDVNGGGWVYENVGPRQYVRRRVEVRHVSGSLAVLAAGPAEGTDAVTRGVAELYGREMGYAK